MSALDVVISSARSGTFKWCSEPDCAVCPRQDKQIQDAKVELTRMRQLIEKAGCADYVLVKQKDLDAITGERDEARQGYDYLRAELTASEMECLRLTVENENLKARN